MSKKTVNIVYTDKELISACCNQNHIAQRELYEKYSPEMYVVAMRYAQTTHEADDILQESFIKVFTNIENFKGDGALGAWIRRIVVNTALKQNRKKIEQAPKEEVTDRNTNGSEDTIISDYSFQELLEMIQKLAVGYRTVFNLYAIEGYKHKEIAKMLGISEGSSKSQYSRAKNLLQKMILKEQETTEQIIREH